MKTVLRGKFIVIQAYLKKIDHYLSGTLSTKERSKQNITRDIEIKNNLTITRGEVGGGNGEKRGKGFQEHV